MTLKVRTPHKLLFEGKAHSAIFPGERGGFEVLTYHKPFLSRLVPGVVEIDRKHYFEIRRGIIRIQSNKVTAIVEE